MSGGFFRGTSADQDTRFSNKQAKLLKSQKFPAELENLVDMTKVKMDVMKPWIAKRVTELIGFEDEVLINFIYGLLEGPAVNGKQVQISLTGFMERNTGKFMKELWVLLLSAQQNMSGVPQQFLDAKEEETKKKKAETDRIANEIQRKKEKEKEEFEQEKTKMDGDNSMSRDKRAELEPSGKHDRKGMSDIQPADEKEKYKRNGQRRHRTSQSPDSTDRQRRSISPNRSPNSRSRSDERRRSSNTSRARPSRSRSVSSGSPRPRHIGTKRSLTPRRRRSPSPRSKRRSISHSRHQSPSPTRHRIRSPWRHRHRSPLSRRSRSPLSRRSRSPLRLRSRSPMRYRSRSPIRRRSRTPVHRRSRSPVRRRSRTPVRRSPMRYRSRSQSWTPRGRSPTPVRRRSPSSMRRRSPSPARRRSLSPMRRRSPSPARRRSPSPMRRRSPSPIQGSSPSPRRGWSPSSANHSLPSPVRRSSPSPVRHRLSSPVRDSSPSLRRHQSLAKKRYRQSPSTRSQQSISPARGRSFTNRQRATAHVNQRSPNPEESSSPHQSHHGSPSPSRRSLKDVRSPSQSPRLRDRRHGNNSQNREGIRPAGSKPLVSLRSPQRDTIDRDDFHGKERDLSSSKQKSSYISHASMSRSQDDERSTSPGRRPYQRRENTAPRKGSFHKSHSNSSGTSADEENVSSREKRRSVGEISRPGSHKDAEKHCTDGIELRNNQPNSDKVPDRVDHKERRQESSPVSKNARLSGRESYDAAAAIVKDKKETEASTKLSTKTEKNGSLDSPSKKSEERRPPKDKEKRKHRKSDKHEVESDSYSSYDSYEERKEAKRRRKEEKRLKKEERRRRREERRRRRDEKRHAEKQKPMSGSDRSSSDENDRFKRKNSSQARNIQDTESEQKRLEIELREKALESLRAKKGFGN